MIEDIEGVDAELKILEFAIRLTSLVVEWGWKAEKLGQAQIYLGNRWSEPGVTC